MAVDTNESACVLFMRTDRRILVVSRKNGSGFALPGGKREENESLKECACREFHEEVWAATTPACLVLAHTGHSSNGRLVELYWANSIFGEPYPVEYGTTVGWFDFDTLLNSSPFAVFYLSAFPGGVEHLRSGNMIV